MISRIESSGNKEFETYLDAIRRKLIDPSVEAKATADFVEKTIIPRRFQEQKGPTGSPWRVSQRVRKYGGRTLSKSNTNEALRFSIRAKINIASGGVNIDFGIVGPASKYGYLHNNGGRIKNRSGKYTTMPKRQFAYLTVAEKRLIITDIWIRGLQAA